MKIFACLAVVSAVPQRHLAPGLRDVEADGRPKWFIEDEGYPAQTSYDFEANKNPNAKKLSPYQTNMIFNLLCRGAATDDFCKQGIESVEGLVPETFAKLFDIGKDPTDPKTKFDPNQTSLISEFMNFTPEELKSIWFNKMLKAEWERKDAPAQPVSAGLAGLLQAPQQTFFRPMHFGHHNQAPIVSHFMWNRFCKTGGDNFMCKARNSIQQQYVDYVKNIKTAYGKIYNF